MCELWFQNARNERKVAQHADTVLHVSFSKIPNALDDYFRTKAQKYLWWLSERDHFLWFRWNFGKWNVMHVQLLMPAGLLLFKNPKKVKVLNLCLMHLVNPIALDIHWMLNSNSHHAEKNKRKLSLKWNCLFQGQFWFKFL